MDMDTDMIPRFGVFWDRLGIRSMLGQVMFILVAFSW